MGSDGACPCNLCNLLWASVHLVMRCARLSVFVSGHRMPYQYPHDVVGASQVEARTMREQRESAELAAARLQLQLDEVGRELAAAQASLGQREQQLAAAQDAAARKGAQASACLCLCAYICRYVHHAGDRVHKQQQDAIKFGLC